MKPDYPKLSPFNAVRLQGESVEVQVADKWYGLLGIDDVDTKSLLTFCQQTYSRIWFKRFSEDLVEVLSEMGHPPSNRVSLKVHDLVSHQPLLLENVAMTEENRRNIWQAAKKHRSNDNWTARLSRADIANDLNFFRQALEHHYAYLKRTGFDYLSSLEQLQQTLEHPTRAEFAIELMKFLAYFGDGHTRLDNRLVQRIFPRGFTPFIVVEVRGKFVALDTHERKLFDPAFPFLTRVDGVELEAWLQVAEQLGPGGSPQFVRLQALKNLRLINYLRQVLELSNSMTVGLELESEDGENRRTFSLDVSGVLPRYSRASETQQSEIQHRILENNVGYLKLARMENDARFLSGLVRVMNEFRRTDALIIDVRGNGGGSRLALKTLFPFFMNSRDEPRVVNVAAYKRSSDEPFHRPEGYLADRYLYPLGSDYWSGKERAHLETFSQSFVPEWPLTNEEFSGFHYFVLSPITNQEYYYYDNRPVVVLLDAPCFSATDIFLGAFKSWRNVVLLGTASGGGSGRPRSVKLPHSELELNLSSMVSFQASGQFYDGRGVSPDITHEPTLLDILDRTDSTVALALQMIGNTHQPLRSPNPLSQTPRGCAKLFSR